MTVATAQTDLGPSATVSSCADPPPSLSAAPSVSAVSTLIIRRAIPDDAQEIAGIGARVFSATFAHTCSAKDMSDYLNANFTPEVISCELSDPAKTYTVVTCGDKLAGFSVLTEGTDEPCLSGVPQVDRVELQRIYVDNCFHGTGVARRLMHDTLLLAQTMGFKAVWLGVWEENFRARAFYAKSGFSMVGTHDFWLGSDRQTDDIFLKYF